MDQVWNNAIAKKFGMIQFKTCFEFLQVLLYVRSSGMHPSIKCDHVCLISKYLHIGFLPFALYSWGLLSTNNSWRAGYVRHSASLATYKD
jgi:hypothetical protein